MSEVFKDFAKAFEFTHITSSPIYPQANGEAERAVATIKNLWKRSSDPYKAMMAYRATPLEHGFSPAQLLMGRQLCTTVPQTSTSLNPWWPNLKKFRRMDAQGHKQQEQQSSPSHTTITPTGLDNHGASSWISS